MAHLRTPHALTATTVAAALILAPCLPTSPLAPSAMAQSLDTVTSTKDGASITMQRDVEAGGDLLIAGTGFGAGTTVVVKLNYKDSTGATRQYRRAAWDAFTHPGNGKADATIYSIITADDEGGFTAALTAPEELVAGQYFTLNVASGLVSGDAQHSITSLPLVVGGVEYVAAPGEEDQVTCVPSASPQTATISGEAVSGVVHVSGRGFCNSISGGAKVAIKIDEGKVERLDTSISDNTTIWQIVEADPETGDFEADVVLPDGTTTAPGGSAEPFGAGEHSLRLLSGSLQDGDPAVSLPAKGETLSFVVGDYAPNGVPDPVHYTEDLTDDAKAGMSITAVSDSQIQVTVPNGKLGDWVYFTAYIADGSARYPWGSTWYRLDAPGQVIVDVPASAPAGEVKLVATNGNQGMDFALAGWAPWTFSQEDSTSAEDITSLATASTALLGAVGTLVDNVNKARPKDTSTTATSASAAPTANTTYDDVLLAQAQLPRAITAGTGGAPASQAKVVGTAMSVSGNAGTYPTKPTTTPGAPVARREQLDASNSFEASATLSGSTFTLALPKAATGDWVFLYVYPASGEPIPAGWAQVDTAKKVALDISELNPGEYTIAAASADGKVAGWVDLITATATSSAASANTETPVAAALSPTASTRMMGSLDWILIIASLVIPVATAGGIGAFQSLRQHRMHASS